ncbi:MAG: NUDIX domain-containing protein [Elusimicrobia bacterium]|nr:NUDIX domain-containing protein [Elusimicrobiota bacterium]
MAREFSAGGLVSRSGKLLLVKVCNLKGEQVWTFPKGHLESGESPLQTALREVEEETGWLCRPCGEAGPIFTAHYRFLRQGRLVFKKVDWFLMRPLRRVGKPDAVEVMEIRWAAPEEAEKLLKYPSDLKLLGLFPSLSEKCA